MSAFHKRERGYFIARGIFWLECYIVLGNAFVFVHGDALCVTCHLGTHIYWCGTLIFTFLAICMLISPANDRNEAPHHVLRVLR